MKTKFSLPNGATYGYGKDGERICTGSQMGRRDEMPEDYAGEKLRLLRLPFVDGCYDQWGAYWGGPANVWCAWGESETEQVRVFVRADTRSNAASLVLEKYPRARFASPVDERVHGILVRCFALPESEGPDRWTAVYPEHFYNELLYGREMVDCVGLSGHSGGRLGPHLGRRVLLAELPESLRQVVMADCEEMASLVES